MKRPFSNLLILEEEERGGGGERLFHSLLLFFGVFIFQLPKGPFLTHLHLRTAAKRHKFAKHTNKNKNHVL